MATQAEVQDLLRFLTGWAKQPLPVAMSKIKELQKAELTTPEAIASSNLEKLKPIFSDEKIAKQVLNAAKRSTKKRELGANDAAPPPKKKTRLEPGQIQTPAELEASLALPNTVTDDEVISQTVLLTNRAPLVLAFAVTLLKYTMPTQPLSSRLSLAQAVVSANSRSKAVSIGIQEGKSAEEEGWGEGWLKIRVLGRDIRAMRRWGYDPTSTGDDKPKEEGQTQESVTVVEDGEEDTPFWGIDLEALKSRAGGQSASAAVGIGDNLPIYTPQSARAYLLKSFETDTDETAAGASSEKSANTTTKKGKKPSSGSAAAEKEKNLGILLGVLDSVFSSWAETLEKVELDRRAWAWYVRVRPEVQNGVAGWGGRGRVKLDDILKLKRET